MDRVYCILDKSVIIEVYKLFDKLVSLDKNVLNAVIQGERVYLVRGIDTLEMSYRCNGKVTRKALGIDLISDNLVKYIFNGVPDNLFCKSLKKIVFNKAYLYEIDDVARVIGDFVCCVHSNSGNASVKAPKSEVNFSDLCELRKNYVGVSHLLGGQYMVCNLPLLFNKLSSEADWVTLFRKKYGSNNTIIDSLYEEKGLIYCGNGVKGYRRFSDLVGWEYKFYEGLLACVGCLPKPVHKVIFYNDMKWSKLLIRPSKSHSYEYEILLK